MKNSKIEWTDSTWNPWRGCTKVSPGCANCYAEALANRFGEPWGKGRPRVKSKSWNDPAKWNKHSFIGSDGERYASAECTPTPTRRTRVFPSRCDWLDAEVPIEWLAEFLELIHDTPNLDWLLLTKRPENWYQRVDEALTYCDEDVAEWLAAWTDCVDMPERGAYPQNVWIGTSVEDQQRADERIPELLKIPAALRFLSVEPLLGPVSVTRFGATTYQSAIDWIIIGGESGPGARPCNVEWIRDLALQGKAAGVPVFVKQLGARSQAYQSTDWTVQKHPKGGDPEEWPEDLRVREMPTIKHGKRVAEKGQP